MACKPLLHVLEEILSNLDVFRASIVVARPARGEHTHAIEGMPIDLSGHGQHRHHGHLLSATPVTLGRVFDQNRPLVVNRSHHVVQSTAPGTNIEPIIVVPMR